MQFYLYLALLATLLPCCAGYKLFQDRLPNGGSVPHPCKPNYIWQGVGHLRPGGGGVRNPFGLDFYRNGKVWNSTLCTKDSDGDGRTNGEELGDPDCVWSPGQAPQVSVGLSHPGVCEPIDRADCKVRNIEFGDICDTANEVNPCINEVKNQDGVKSLRVSLPETPVPAVETTYMCHVITVPSDQDYHIIAAEPYIVNRHVMHHVAVYGCQDSAVLTEAPGPCGMARADCRDLLMTWVVGDNGFCLDEEFGFRIGKSGFKMVLLQTHWNNPQLRSDYTDSSGMTIYFTPNLRPNDGGTLVIGSYVLAIPPGESDYAASGTCSSNCTQTLPHSIYIAGTNIHMHYLGIKGYIEHYREGSKVTDLVKQDVYSYDSPVTFTYDSPIEVRRGDSLKTTCHFKSTSRNKVTNFGEATSDEMCLGFVTYYPKVNITECVSAGEYEICGNNPLIAFPAVGDCDYDNFEKSSAPYWTRLYEKCDVTGMTCRPDCRSLLSNWTSSDPCMAPEALSTTKEIIRTYAQGAAKDIIALLESCDGNKTDAVEEPTGDICDLEEFGRSSLPNWERLYQSCDMTGDTCLPGCRALIDEWTAADPCLRGDALREMKSAVRTYSPDTAEQSLTLLESCDSTEGNVTSGGSDGEVCDYDAFGANSPPYWEELYQKCDMSGETCLPACRTLLKEWTDKEPCLRGDALNNIKSAIRTYAPDTAVQSITLLESCDSSAQGNGTGGGSDGQVCDFDAFGANSQPYWEELYQKCDMSGETCLPACRTLLEEWTDTEPCLRGDALSEIKSVMRTYAPDTAEQSITLLESCDSVTGDKPDSKEDEDYCDLGAFGDNSRLAFDLLYKMCDMKGESCLPACKTLLDTWSAQDPCMRGGALGVTKAAIRQLSSAEQTIQLIESCDKGKPIVDKGGKGEKVNCLSGGSNAASPANRPLVYLGMIAAVLVLGRL